MICPNCKSENPSDAKFCTRCGTKLNATFPASNASFPSFIEHKANFNEGANSIGGKIIITPTQLIFRAHSFNIGNLNDRVFEIKDIIGYKKGFLTFLTISFSDGRNIKLTVWGKDEIINQLESRRRALM